MMKYKCIIFDCDGVLVDSETIGNLVLIDMANELGANIDLDFAIENFTGTSIKHVINIIGERISSDVPESFTNEYRRKSFEAFEKQMKPVPGIEEVLKHLTIPFCTASNGPLNKMTLNLKVTGLLPYFEGKMFSAYQMKKWKPDPSLFLHAAKTMGFEPKDCLVIEDSLPGVQAAIAGDFNVYGYANQHNQKDFEKLGVKTFCSMRELLELLK